MNCKPMYDNVLIRMKKVGSEELSPGGIIIPKNEFSDTYSEGEIVAIGEGYRVDDKLVPLKVEVGDTIIFRKGVEIKIVIDGEEFGLTSEGTILAIKEE